MANKNYLSNNITLCDIVEKNICFNIPIYQRLYVWKELQVNKLLEDIFDAYSRHEDNYYLGGVVTYSNGERCDLIDGQQRFTTLWLICMVISSMEPNVCDEMKKFCGNKQELRIQFAIRPQITEFLMGRLEKAKRGDDNINQVSDVKNMIDAIGNIETFCQNDERRDSLTGFASFIMKNVILVRTEIPEETDLNKLFELINGRGQQLSQTDILKSHILDLIRKETNENEDWLIRYGQIWNACADMNEYVEHNIQQEDSSLTWKDRLLYDKKSDGDEEGVIADFGDDFFDNYIQNPVKDEPIDQQESLLNIVKSALIEEGNKDNNDDGHEHTTLNGREVRSIVSFQMLLLYTLRIFLIEKKLRLYGEKKRYDIEFFNEKKLLKIFAPAVQQMKQDKSAHDFIKKLWMVRVLFDKNVVKWVKEDGETDEVLTIRALRISTDKRTGNIRVHRDSANTGNSITEMTQLQSILYFSQPRIYELWICPFLYHSFTEDDPSDLLKYLKQLDNVLLCLPYKNDEDMLWRTYNVMINGLGNYKEEEFYDYFCQLAEQEDGCNFSHYIFYKMEFILWWDNKRKNSYPYWNTYRLTSKNSVEHINPQTPKFNKSQISYLNSFGNLVLVSREVNSSYSNKSFKEKQAQFIDKRDNGHQIDSLKSDVIYSTNVEEWRDSECEKHLRDMENIANDYFCSTTEDYRAISDDNNLIRKWVSKEYRDNRIQLLAEEIAKAKQILNGEQRSDGKTWEEKIIEAENYAFFKGAIRFLFQNADGKVTKDSWELFDNKWANAQKYFDKDGVKDGNENDKLYKSNALLMKSLLANGDWNNIWWHFEFSNDANRWKRILTSGNWRNAVDSIMREEVTNETIEKCVKSITEHIKNTVDGSEERKNLSYIKNIVDDGLMDYVCNNMSGAWIRSTYHGYHAIWKSGYPASQIVLNPILAQLKSKNIVDYCENNRIENCRYYKCVDKNVDFKYGSHFFQWYGNPNKKKLDVYLMENDWANYKERPNPTSDKGTDEDRYYCFRVTKDMESDPSKFTDALNELINQMPT